MGRGVVHPLARHVRLDLPQEAAERVVGQSRGLVLGVVAEGCTR